MKTFCQILIVLFIVIGFFYGLYQDFHGRESREPYGYSGAIITIVVFALMFLVIFGAGALSELADR